MIINGGSRSNGRFFAVHLMRADHNERVEVRDIRGLLAENIADALREMRDVASGTSCKNYFYHADINTREDEHLTPEQWTAAADALERELNMTGQPRFIVEHEKNGRTHQHIIWSRIDIDSMTAISDSHNYRRHEAVARALEKAFDHQPTPGPLSREYGAERPERCPKDWETFRAQESRIDPKALKVHVTELWNSADSGQAFVAAVKEQGYLLAKGDRRDFCIIDHAGDEHSLARQVSGVKAAQIRARMADVDRETLPSVAEARAQVQAQAEKPAGDSTSAQETPEAVLEPPSPEPATQVTPDAPIPPTASLSDFEAIVAETVREAAADAEAERQEEQRSPGARFARFRAWLGGLREYWAEWRDEMRDIFAAVFGRETGEQSGPAQEREVER